MLKSQLQTALQHLLSEMGIVDVPVQISTPELQFGDYSTNVALIAAKKLGKNPRELAEEIKEKMRRFEEASPLGGQMTNIEKIDIAGPGFLNFWLSPDALIQKVHPQISNNSIRNHGQNRPVVVEYSSPNIAKPFTIGHLRSTIIGDAVANLLEVVGYKVYRDNHLGDWGTQFGKQIYALLHLGEGSLDKNLHQIESSERPVELLVKLYVEFHAKAEENPALEDEAREWFKKLEAGDPQARDLWQKCIDWSWREFNAIYEKLGVTFTENNGRGYGESFFEDKMSSVIKELHDKKLLQEGKEGAQLVFFPEERQLPALMILKKDGASLYATRDLATDKFRLEHYGKDVLVINEVGAEQSLYWEQIYATEQLLHWYRKEQRVHVKHGLYRFKEGKMSTRKGNVIWLEEVLSEAIERAQQLSDSADTTLAQKVGIGALKWNDLKRDAKQDIVFDWDDMLNMQGNSGPYMQYTYARTRSVLKKAQRKSDDLPTMLASQEPEEELVLRLLAKFDETLIEAAEKYSPNMLCTYLFTLAQQFNLFYQKCPILKVEGQVRENRLALTLAVSQTLKTGLTLLGIQAPDSM